MKGFSRLVVQLKFTYYGMPKKVGVNVTENSDDIRNIIIPKEQPPKSSVFPYLIRNYNV